MSQVPITEGEEAAQPEKLAIGVPGGFDVGKPKEKIEEECFVVVEPAGVSVPLPCPDFPPTVLESVISIQVSGTTGNYTTISMLLCGLLTCIVLS